MNVSLDTLPDTPLSIQPCVLLISPWKITSHELGIVSDVIVNSSISVPINITLNASPNVSRLQESASLNSRPDTQQGASLLQQCAQPNAPLDTSHLQSVPQCVHPNAPLGTSRLQCAQPQNFDIISSTRTDYPSWSTKRPIYKYKLPNYNNTGLTYPVMFEKIQNLVQGLVDPHKEIKYYGGGRGLRIETNIYDIANRASLLLDKKQSEQFTWTIPFDNFKVIISPETTDEERDICITILGLYIFIACEHTSDNASNDNI